MKKLLLIAILFLSVIVTAQVQVVSDINIGTDGSNIDNIFEFKNHLFFSATIDGNRNRGSEKLWTTDGTDTGTYQINNLPPKGFYKTDDYLYYSNDNGEIWKSDGTEANTSKIKENLYGLASVGTYDNFFYYIAEITSDYTNRDVGLFKTNGTTTTLIKTFLENERLKSYESLEKISKFDATRFIVYLYTVDLGTEPYISDGTEAGTFLLKDINSGRSSSSPTTHIPLNNGTIFTYNEKLWFSDGTTAGTINLKPSISAKELTFFNDKVYFASGKDFYETDGTETGTKIVFSNKDGDERIQSIVKRENDLLLILEKGIHIFNGTSNNTTRITIPNITYYRYFLAKLGNKYFFTADYKTEGKRVWSTDGTVAGTSSLEPFWPDGAIPYATETFSINNKIVFTTGTSTGGYDVGELWITDGTNAGTKLLKDINKTGNLNSTPKFQTTLNGKIYFAADDNIHGKELFVFDGTTTSLVKDINPGFQPSKPHDFYVLNNTIIFKAYTADKGLELWITDGTEAGTKILKDINPTGDGFVRYNSDVVIGNFAKLNNELIFYADNGTKGLELWKTDGTEAGTFMLKDINVGFQGSTVANNSLRPRFVEHKNELYFIASNAGNNLNSLTNYQMWKTDGTATGTKLDASINNAVKANSIYRYTYVSFNDQLYFIGLSEGRDNLFRSNGTTTVKVDGVYRQDALYALQDKIYFSNKNGGGVGGLGEEIWSIDKNDNVAIVKDIVEGAQGANPINFYIFKNYLYFSIRNKSYQPELWRLSDTVAPEPIITKETESSTTSLDQLFDYIPNGDKLFINTQQHGNPNFLYKMYVIENDKPIASTPFTINNNNVAYNNLNGSNSGGLGYYSTFLNDDFYFMGNIEDKGEELLKVNFSTVLSVDDFNVNSNNNISFTIYPNPVNNILTIKSKTIIHSAAIYNLLGKKISTISKNYIDVSNLTPGIYILKIEDQLGNKSSKKWVKM